MREELLQKILIALQNEDIEIERVKSRLIIAMDGYEITSRCTEVAVVDEDDTEKYIRMFLLNKRVAGRTENTLRTYRATLDMFFRECRKSPLEVTADDIKMFLAVKEVRDNASKAYLKDLLRPVSSFYQWMQREDHITKNPMNKVDDIKVPKVKKNALTEQDIERMRITIGDDLRLMCMFELLLSTWCRVSELAQIKRNEIAQNRESVLIHGKGQKDRICYINARAKIYLDKYLAERSDSNQYLFPNCSIRVGEGITFSHEAKKANVKQKDWWKAENLVGDSHIDKCSIESAIRKIGRKTGIEKVHPHRFRRTGATFALRRGMPIEQVSKLLGHESIETTQIYLDISENELEQSHKKYV